VNERPALAERMRQFREKLGLSQREMADLVSVSHGTIGHWETGRSVPSVSDLERLAEALEWPAQDVYYAAGLIGTERPRSAYEVLAALEREGRPLPRQRSADVSRQKPWPGSTRTVRATAPQQGDDESSAVRYRGWRLPEALAHSARTLAPA
jgi:transcriptional regulator with XRE-family HTH domain